MEMSSSASGGQQTGASAPNPSMQALHSGKASAAPPQSTTDGVELKNITAGIGGGEAARPALPIESDIMQLARLGEIGAMQKLFDTKKFNAKYKDEEGITPLHVTISCLQYIRLSLSLTTLIILAVGGDQ